MNSKTKLPHGTVTKLSAALHLSKRRCQELLAEGMPHDIEGAVAWRKAHTSTDSAERLRLERIGLVKSQRARIEMENATRRGELVPAGEVRASMTRICSAARAELLKFASDLPPRLAGLSEPQMAAIIREATIEVLTRLADETSELYRA